MNTSLFVLLSTFDDLDVKLLNRIKDCHDSVFFVGDHNIDAHIQKMDNFILFNHKISRRRDIKIMSDGRAGLLCMLVNFLCSSVKVQFDHMLVVTGDMCRDQMFNLKSIIEANDDSSDFMYMDWRRTFVDIKKDPSNNWTEWSHGQGLFKKIDLMGTGCAMFRLSRRLLKCVNMFVDMYKRIPPVELMLPSVCHAFGLKMSQIVLPIMSDVTSSVLTFEPQSDCVVFTSCGDRSTCHELWTNDQRNYDIVAVYYGDRDEVFNTYSDKFDVVIRRKGSKFQNFFHMFNTTNILDKYKYFFVLDDDIIFNTTDINQMFDFAKSHPEVQICQPAFSRPSNISHPVTKQHSACRYRYTNFVEVNTPLFTRVSVDKLARVYQDRLIGWGIDALYIWAVNDQKDVVSNSCKKFAIVDYVTCINPKTKDKPGDGRELYLLEHAKNRRKVWEEVAKQLNINTRVRGRTLEKIK